ncbi:PfkB family carbohydrate kinase [Bacteroidales bacterium OttesenSCG-928-K22]|nr:PfkB family carbohydrate kinase [Bacteroidales bacterium OttesenSCG-928-L14]MDL2240107.1 PfkB family carbohydrate kinase [Bacteroidales bacterium OttesenSCG-928-K22]
MSFSFINGILPNFKGVRILIVGDIMLDIYLYGMVNRMSPEFPVPVVNLESRKYYLGGAANVAANIKALGAKVEICSVIGNDKEAKVVSSLFKEAELDFSGVVQSDLRMTTRKNRVIGNNKQLVRIDEEDDFCLTKDEEEKLIIQVERKVKELSPHAIILQDYNKGVLSLNVINSITQLAQNENIKICVDPKKKNFDKYNDVYIFKPNLKEFCEYNRSVPKINIPDLLSQMQKFQEKHNINIFLLTMADKGVLISDKNGRSYHFPAYIRQISDVSGAGDTVISIASLLAAVDADIEEIAYISNVAGGLVCEKSGVATITVEELNKELIKYKSIKQ